MFSGLPDWRLIRQNIGQAKRILLREGPRALGVRMSLKLKRFLGLEAIGHFDFGYESWRKKQASKLKADGLNTADALIKSMDPPVLFSILVPVYDVEEKWLDKMLGSVERQLYPHWQLCLVDDCSNSPHIKPWLEACRDRDPRITIGMNEVNSGIAATSNHALTLAKGNYIVLLDHDDELAEDALLENAKLINGHPNLDVIYSDEDKIRPNGKHASPFFKPDFSLDLLRSQNYFGHLVVARRHLVEEVGGFTAGVDGAQDYDLVLRLCERTTAIAHLPKVLYHWREIPGSTAASFGEKSYAWEAGKIALSRHCERLNLNAYADYAEFPGSYRLRYQIEERPKISIVIPFKDQGHLLDTCLGSLFEQSDYPSLEVIGIDNNSEEDTTRSVISKWQQTGKPIRFVTYPFPFNFSAICNFGLTQSSGEYVVLMNNDIEILSPGWVEAMLEHAQRDDIGAVGAKLLYPNHHIQHAGIVLGIDQGAGHPFKHMPNSQTGYFLRHHLIHNVSAVTGALMMVKKSRLLQAGALDEALGVAYNDVDLCLSLAENGYRNLLTPYCLAIHHESVSRGHDQDPEKQARHDTEKNRLRAKWPGIFADGDPFYNPNLTLAREDYSLNNQA